MGDFVLKEGQITMFVNKDYVPPDGSPDFKEKPKFTGELKMNGNIYEVAIWRAKSGKEGCFSGNVKAPR